MPALSELRADIKNWERAFKTTNAREPTIHDIKLQPHIADKYKLYKKLSKSTVAPSTPPKVPCSDHPSTLPATRPVIQTAPLSTFNPFSPQKKTNEKTRASVEHESSLNPFDSPRKPKGRPRSPNRSPSPELFPLRFALEPTSSSSVPPPYPATAMSRARKRLRGEPVSPSPSKEKRRRVMSQTTLPFPRFHPGPDDPGHEGDRETLNDSPFVDNSPMKPHAKGKHFAPLFNERAVPMDDVFEAKTSTTSTKNGLDVFRDAALESQMATRELANGHPSTGVQKSKSSSGNTSDSLHAQKSNSHGANTKLAKDIRSSRKRSLSDTEEDPFVAREIRPKAKPHLLPPSPPATSDSFVAGKKGQGKAADNRKKAKLANNTEIDGESESEMDLLAHKGGLKLIDRSHTRAAHTIRRAYDGEHIGPDSDPILVYASLTAPHGRSIHTTSHPQDGKFEVDLPDELRRVLSLGYLDAKSRDCQEAQVAKSVLYGRKLAPYNPDKGGEIWDIGEKDAMEGEENTRTSLEVEDDWEGEPVPWEVGEL